MAAPSLARPILVLASASPRRLNLLAAAGIVPDAVAAPGIDERVRPRELPRPHAERLARAKAEAIAARLAGEGPAAFVLAADTVVAAGRRILPKAETPDEVAACLALLSGRRHRVMTAVALAVPGGALRLRTVTTQVRFKRLTADEIAAYATAGDGLGKAGGYAIQGQAAAFVPAITGSYTNVVGLPLTETITLLTGAGWRRGG